MKSYCESGGGNSDDTALHQTGEEESRGAGAAANLAMDVADARGTVAIAAKSLTLAVSGVAVSMARSSATLLDEI